MCLQMRVLLHVRRIGVFATLIVTAAISAELNVTYINRPQQ